MVVKRAWPCSSTLMPLAAPMGFSGAFSRVGASVFSAHCFSDSDGWRPFSRISVTGDSATAFPLDLRLFGMCYPTLSRKKTLNGSGCGGREQGADYCFGDGQGAGG